MDIRVIPEPTKLAVVVHTPTIAMRKELYILMYQISREHRDEAMKVDGKNKNEEIKHSMICILFCYTCLEAFINTIGKDKLGNTWEERWGENKESSTSDKWLGVSKLLASKKYAKQYSVFNKRKEPFKSFLCLQKIRHYYLVHWKAEFSEVVKTKYGNTDGTINKLNYNTANKACNTVKEMVLELVKNMDDAPEVNWLK